MTAAARSLDLERYLQRVDYRGAVQPTAQVLADPQVAHMQWVEPLELPNGVASKTVISPQRVSGRHLGVRRGPPALGAHTDEVLRELKIMN